MAMNPDANVDSHMPTVRRLVRCPQCGGDSVYAPSNPARPFCSERCKNMDLGAWASESFRVADSAQVTENALADPDLH